jgi:hypothetical protein
MKKFIVIVLIIWIGGSISNWLGYHAGALLGLIGYIITLLMIFFVGCDDSLSSKN